MSRAVDHRDSAMERLLVMVGLVLLAVNLRPAVTSLGTAMPAVRSALGMSAAVAGLLTTLPVLCFAGFGPVGTGLARRFGVHRTVLAALVVVTGGLALRVSTDSVLVFVFASAIVLAGIAGANVVLPTLVKRHFPDRISSMTGLYSAALMAGAALPSVVVVPVSQATGSWRGGLAVWAATAAVALIPWLALLRHDVPAEPTPDRIRLAQLVHSPLAWSMASFFGVQSVLAYSEFGWLPQIYADAGLSPSAAAWMLGIVTATAIPVPLLLPLYVGRYDDQRPLVVVFGVTIAAGFAGLLLAPGDLPWLWALLLGVGGCAFPWLLALLGLRAHSEDGTAVLSGFVQSLGYLVSAIGPLGVGLLYDGTGGWTVPLVLLGALAVPQVWLGLRFARPRFVEDELAVRSPAPRAKIRR